MDNPCVDVIHGVGIPNHGGGHLHSTGVGTHTVEGEDDDDVETAHDVGVGALEIEG